MSVRHTVNRSCDSQPWVFHISSSSPAFLSSSGNDHLVMLTTDGDLYTLGCGEQGQLGRVPELFANRGGRQGLGKWLWYLQRDDFVSYSLAKVKGRRDLLRC